jgi:hypothetical protein
MARDTFVKLLFQLVQAIRLCIQTKLQLPALMLLYSAIDICGWLASPNDQQSTRASFTAWAEKYILPSKPLPVTAIDLYAARCGLLHTYTPESSIAAAGAARKIAYAWGNTSAQDLQKTIDLEGRTDLVALHISDLLEGFHLRLSAYFSDLDNNPALAARFDNKASKSFATSTTLVRDYLDVHKGAGA